MASQVAHIIYAKKYLEKYPLPNGAKDEFLAGCIFPDIRLIDHSISRRDTHLRFDPVDLNFEGLSAFESGWKFHLYCDMKREEILNKYNFYALDNAAELWGRPAKLLEDEVVYDSYNNWEKLRNYFNNSPVVDTGINVARETFELWYAINAKYIEKKPDSKSMKIFLSKLPKLAGISSEIIDSADKLRENSKVVEILGEIKEEIV